MSTGQIIQIAATAVGAYFGGPWGALIGSQAGGYVGRSVDAKHTDVSAEGPRLSDFKVQLASYGVAVPRVYGRASIAGNVIWSSDIIEHVTTSSSTQDAGKGGGGDSQTVNLTTYSYSVHLAIGLCAGPIAGIGKIWANGKLIYNGKAGTDAQTVLASQTLADGIRLYLGSETQSADALIQSFEGAANVPAYRGLAYIVLEDFQLADFGNRIPQFEFEVIASATTQLPGIMGAIPATTGADSIVYEGGVYSVGTITIGGASSSFRKKPTISLGRCSRIKRRRGRARWASVITFKAIGTASCCAAMAGPSRNSGTSRRTKSSRRIGWAAICAASRSSRRGAPTPG
jgi:hypothetical protein